MRIIHHFTSLESTVTLLSIHLSWGLPVTNSLQERCLMILLLSFAEKEDFYAVTVTICKSQQFLLKPRRGGRIMIENIIDANVL
jgi:hypothetical protein